MRAATVNVHEAKTHLSRLLERVESGEEVVIARAGKPVARLVPITETITEPRQPGSLRGKVSFTEDWDSPEVNDAVAEPFLEERG